MREFTSRLHWRRTSLCSQVARFVVGLIGLPAAAHAAVVWQPGDLISYNQASWTTTTQGAAALTDNYFSVYLSSFGVLEIGIPGSAGYSIQFTSPTTISTYIPTNGPPAPLVTDLVDPVTTSAGIFGGDVLALQMDIDFSDHGALNGSLGLLFGDLIVSDLTGTMSGLNGLSVRQIDAIVNNALGGGATGYTVDDLDLVAQDLGNSFDVGTVSMWAQDHLAPAAPSSVPEPSTWLEMLVGFAAIGFAMRGRNGSRARANWAPEDQRP